jgi:DNA-binding transcriptional LysR family regulator
MRNLHPDQVRSLIEVIERGSFTDAAKRLQLTQPAISRQIHEPENRCGVQLVERVGKRAIATPAGRELIAHGKQIIADSEHALAAVRLHKDGAAGRVHVGAGPTALVYLLPPMLRKMRDEYRILK